MKNQCVSLEYQGRLQREGGPSTRSWRISRTHNKRKLKKQSFREFMAIQSIIDIFNLFSPTRSQEVNSHYSGYSPTSSDSDRNSCMMSLSPMTRIEHTIENKDRIWHEALNQEYKVKNISRFKYKSSLAGSAEVVCHPWHMIFYGTTNIYINMNQNTGITGRTKM